MTKTLPSLHQGFTICWGNDIAAGATPARTAAVDGDGEGGSADQPQLQTAYFVGDGEPGFGEYLYLEYHEEIALRVGAVFNSTDMDFWDAGDTIGTSSPIPIILDDARTVRITLGTSPDFTVNMSRIQTSTLNDVITDLAGNEPYVPGVPVRNDYLVVAKYDEIPPVLEQLSINNIPEILNGSGPAGGNMLAPRKGFDISMEYDDGDGSGVDTDAIVILCSRNVTVNGSTVSAGTNLAPDLILQASSATGAAFRVPAAMEFKTGSNILWARVTDFMGLHSTSRSFTFDVTNPSNSMRPFETGSNPSQVWNIRFTRDIYTINVSGAAYISVSATMTPNGIPDFNEDMICFGLRSLAPIAVPGTALNSNQLVFQELVDAIKTELSDVIFPGVNITFTELNQGVIPGNVPQVSYNNFTHSQISVGGDSDTGSLGTAWIDRNNAHQDNNMLYKGSAPYNPGTNLGMFTTRLFRFEVNGSQFGLFRQTFDDFIPGRGTPMGEGADDEDILMEIAGTGPAVGGAAAVRRDALLAAIAGLARSISVITAHEMGHSMGLSVNDPMPDGLYGGDPVHFPGSSDCHLDLSSFPALFISPAVNIMTPATNYWYTSAVGTRFNNLNMAYLREKVFYNP